MTTFDFFLSYTVNSYLISTNIVGMGSTCHTEWSLPGSARSRWQAVELGIQASLDRLIALAVNLSYGELLWNCSWYWYITEAIDHFGYSEANGVIPSFAFAPWGLLLIFSSVFLLYVCWIGTCTEAMNRVWMCRCRAKDNLSKAVMISGVPIRYFIMWRILAAAALS